MLVANALDAVRAEAVHQQRRALQRLAGGDLAGRPALLQVVAAGNRAGRTGGQRHAAETVVRSHDLVQDVLDGRSGDLVVPEVVAELLELVEDHQILAGAAQLPALVEDLLDVAFRTGRLDDLTGHAAQPVKAFLAHTFGQDCNRLTGQQVRVVGAAAAVVAGGGPDSLLRRRVELAGDQPRRQAAKGRTDLVRAGREPLADDQHNARPDAGQLGREFDVIHVAVATAKRHRLVAPGDAKQVERVQIPQANIAQLRLDAVRNQIRVAHLLECRNDDMALTRAPHGSLQPVFVDSQVDHCWCLLWA